MKKCKTPLLQKEYEPLSSKNSIFAQKKSPFDYILQVLSIICDQNTSKH